jgi:hypothetical protein
MLITKTLLKTRYYNIDDFIKVLYIKSNDNKKLLFFIKEKTIPYGIEYYRFVNNDEQIEDYLKQRLKEKFEFIGNVRFYKFINNKYQI